MTRKNLLVSILLTALIIAIVLLGLSAVTISEQLSETDEILNRFPEGYLPDTFVTAIDVGAAYELLPHIGAVILFGGLAARAALDVKREKAANKAAQSAKLSHRADKVMLTGWVILLIISTIMLGLASWTVNNVLSDSFGTGVNVNYSTSSGVTSNVDCAYMLLMNIGAVLLFGGLTIYTACSMKKKIGKSGD